MNPKKILIMKFRNIGDVLLTSPVFAALKISFPNANISVAVKEGTEEAVNNNPFIDEVLILPKRFKTESILSFGRRYLKWALYLRKKEFDLAVNTTDGDRGIILSALIGAKHRRSETSPSHHWWHRLFLHKYFFKPLDLSRHTILRNLSLIQDLASTPKVSVDFCISSSDQDKVLELLTRQGYIKKQKLIHIHPTSRWLFKCWSDIHMSKVIDELIKEGYQVVLTSAPEKKELDRVENILCACKTKPFNLAGRLSLQETGAVSKISSAFFGVDTAPMHIAAAVGTPVIALFGPSSGRVWGPWPNEIDCTKNPYPKKNGIQSFGPHTILQKSWVCVPCGRDGCEGTKKSACLDCISPEVALEYINLTILSHA